MINIVLHQPEIAENTGNIGRTCVSTGSRLHLIEPLGFALTEKRIKAAGLDYWDKLDVIRYGSYKDFLEKNDFSVDASGKILSNKNGGSLYFATTKGEFRHSEARFNDGDYIMFGKESAGIPEEVLCVNKESCIRIPMVKDNRSLNLANSVAIVLYEALRQLDYLDLEVIGHLHRLNWKEGV